MIVTRFAPSPTGFLHLGHAYAALRAYEAARADDGRFLLRIEDIDMARCRPEFERAIFEDLRWLGIAWEEPVRRQSEHFADYTSALAKLEAAGLVYPCFCTRREIAAEIARAGMAPSASDSLENVYPGTCRSLPDDTRARRIAEGEAYALRFDVAKARARHVDALALSNMDAVRTARWAYKRRGPNSPATSCWRARNCRPATILRWWWTMHCRA
jgi:glutamyl-Q tRNA(Asp) synthetase